MGMRSPVARPPIAARLPSQCPIRPIQRLLTNAARRTPLAPRRIVPVRNARSQGTVEHFATSVSEKCSKKHNGRVEPPDVTVAKLARPVFSSRPSFGVRTNQMNRPESLDTKDFRRSSGSCEPAVLGLAIASSCSRPRLIPRWKTANQFMGNCKWHSVQRPLACVEWATEWRGVQVVGSCRSPRPHPAPTIRFEMEFGNIWPAGIRLSIL
jgi:hypothetical protein